MTSNSLIVQICSSAPWRKGGGWRSELLPWMKKGEFSSELGYQVQKIAKITRVFSKNAVFDD